MMGTLFEYADALSQLRAEEKKRGIYDRSAWQPLAKWERIGRSKSYEMIRNQAAFHIDRNVVNKGIGRLLRRGVGSVRLLAGDDAKLRNSYGRFGHDALLAGLDARIQGRLIGTVRNLRRFIHVHDDLEPELLRILDALGLKPIMVRLR
jgi:hypothetical protein